MRVCTCFVEEMTVQGKISGSSAPSAYNRGATFCRAFNTALVATVLVFASALQAAESPPSEYQVKGAFLLNFTKFIEWPAAVFEKPDSPFGICILGEDPFGRDLDALLEGEVVGRRKLTVQRLRSAPIPKACQVLFVSKSEKTTSSFLEGLGPGILTVSDRDEFLREGGMIAFVIQNRRVRFDINRRATERASLTISARMLKVARSVQK